MGAWGIGKICRVKFCTAAKGAPPAPVAVIVKRMVIGVVKGLGMSKGKPLNVAVPSWLSVKMSPLCDNREAVKTGLGKPVVVTVKEFWKPFQNVVWFALVIVGVETATGLTTRVKLCRTAWPTELVAVNVIG